MLGAIPRTIPVASSYRGCYGGIREPPHAWFRHRRIASATPVDEMSGDWLAGFVAGLACAPAALLILNALVVPRLGHAIRVRRYGGR